MVSISSHEKGLTLKNKQLCKMKLRLKFKAFPSSGEQYNECSHSLKLVLASGDVWSFIVRPTSHLASVQNWVQYISKWMQFVSLPSPSQDSQPCEHRAEADVTPRSIQLFSGCDWVWFPWFWFRNALKNCSQKFCRYRAEPEQVSQLNDASRREDINKIRSLFIYFI